MSPVRAQAPVRRVLLVVAMSSLSACSASKPAQAPAASASSAAPPISKDRLDELRGRARTIARELAVLGFPIKASEVTLSLQDNAPRSRVTDTTTRFEPSRIVDALGTLRELLGSTDKEPRDYGGAVLAYYDIGGQYVVFNDSQLSRSGDADQVVAHELVHVYQDQSQGGGEEYSSVHAGWVDETLSAHAIAEGEAQLIARALLYKRYGADLGVRDARIPNDGLGWLLTESIVGGPYVAGEDFLWARYREGGFAAVQEAYRHPPKSTEQLLHPDKYERDTPRVVTLPEWPDPTARVRLADREILGESVLAGVLAEALIDDDDTLVQRSDEAELAAVGWDGDCIDVYVTEEGRSAVLFRSVWDTDAAAQRFAATLRRILTLNEKLTTVYVDQRAAVVDLAYSQDTSLLPALARALEQHPRHFRANADDAASTRAAEQVVAARQAARPRVEQGYWLHPLSGVRVPVPEGWKPRPLRGVPVLAGARSHGVTPYLAAQPVPDIHHGDLALFLKVSQEQISRSSLYAGDITSALRSMGGTQVGVISLKLGLKSPTALCIWVIPRAGHYLLLGLRMSADDWAERQDLVQTIERGLRVEALPAAPPVSLAAASTSFEAQAPLTR
jgi:hypothetical protein